jgi:hypothetical protein
MRLARRSRIAEAVVFHASGIAARPKNCLKAIGSNSFWKIHMGKIDPTNLMRSFTERRQEADQRAREVLDEFIRVGRALAMDSVMWHEVAGLDQSWRDSLSDSEVIKYLRALYPDPSRRRPKPRRP